MKILIDIGHPAHVHYFKNLAWIFLRKGHKVLFTCRDKEVVIDLLKSYNFDYINIGKPYKKIYGKVLGLFYFDFKILKASLRFKPDIFVSAGSIYAAQVSWLSGKPHITLEDTFNMEQVRLYLPFTNAIITGDYPHKDLGKNEIRIPSYQELAYLHPNYYKADKNILKELGIKEGERYFILRFVSWNASHDVGQKGLSWDIKKQLIKQLAQYGKVFISSEQKLSIDLEPYRFILPPEKMHDALFFADLFIGEGATMASECAMLGTPAIYVNSIIAGTIQEQEKYGLLYHFKTSNGVLRKVIELIEIQDIKQEFKKRRQKMLADKIDVTAFIVWIIENYPNSINIIKENPDYQDKFK